MVEPRSSYLRRTAGAISRCCYCMGILIIADQLGKVLGIEVRGDAFFSQLGSAIGNLDQTDLTTVALAAATVAAATATVRWTPSFPGPLIGLALRIALVAVAGLADDGVALVAPVPQGFPELGLPSLSDGGARRTPPFAPLGNAPLPAVLATGLIGLDVPQASRWLRRTHGPRAPRGSAATRMHGADRTGAATRSSRPRVRRARASRTAAPSGCRSQAVTRRARARSGRGLQVHGCRGTADAADIGRSRRPSAPTPHSDFGGLSEAAASGSRRRSQE
jgi:hypothetical protein